MKINKYIKQIQYEFRDNIFIELDIDSGSYTTCIYCDWGQILLDHGYMDNYVMPYNGTFPTSWYSLTFRLT